MLQALFRKSQNDFLIFGLLPLLCLGGFSACTTEVLSPSGVPMKAPTTRPSPPKIEPIIIHGKKYGGGFNQGALPISDAASGKKIKNVTIYSYPDNGSAAVFFKSMKLVNNNQDILIENEIGEKFLFNLRTEKVSPGKTNQFKPTAN
jgi:hypothetical protein